MKYPHDINKAMPRILPFLLTLSCALGATALHAKEAVAQCGLTLQGPRTQIESEHYLLSFSSGKQAVKLGQHFALDVVVCPKAGASAASELQVDAVMPAHQHGMNYRPKISRNGPKGFRAEGLFLHMPGVWEFRFDVRGKAGSPAERLSHSMSLQ